jgi:hypothetical protein
MKKTITTAMLVAAGFITSQFAAAQSLTPVTNYANVRSGDLILGVEQLNNSGTAIGNNYMVDLGPLGSLLTGTLNLSADLGSVFSNLNNVQYGLFAVSASRNGTITYSAPVAGFFSNITGSTAVPFANYVSVLGNAGGNVGLSYGLRYGSGLANGASVAASDPNSWSSALPQTAAFAAIGDTSIESALGNDVYLLSHNNSGDTALGVVNLGTDGVLTYTAAPEPGTYALFGLGALFLIIMARRRSNA